MNLDPLLLPFIAGLPLALALPRLGLLLRLREEWLAALGLAHLSAATALAAHTVHLPALAGATAGALAGGAGKHFLRVRGNAAFALMILAGWASTLLIASNSPLGEALAHALIEGQLYFAGLVELLAALGISLSMLLALPWLTPRLVRAHHFPTHEAANRLPAWRWQLGFEWLSALVIAVATATLGLMATFALIFVTPWIAHRLARNWRHGARLASGAGLFAYGVAFALALALDQPFAPILVAVLLLLLGLSAKRIPAQPGEFR